MITALIERHYPAPDPALAAVLPIDSLSPIDGSELAAHAAVADDVFDGALGGPPIDNKAVRSGVLVSGCRPHSCYERGAILFDNRRRIEAVALLNFGSGDPRSTAHSDKPKLAIFMPRTDRSDLLRQEMEAWAQSQYGPDVPRTIVWLKPRARR